MEKNKITNKYELMLIVDAGLSEDEKQAVYKEATEIVSKSGAKVINSQVWLDRQKMTFRIKKCKEATYYLVNFEGDKSTVSKMRPGLKLNERILRSAIIQA